MKKVFAILLCGLLFAGCGSAQEPDVSAISSSDGSMLYSYNDFDHGIPYSGGEFTIDKVAFTEEKSGDTYNAGAAVLLNFEYLPKDARQQFEDEFSPTYYGKLDVAIGVYDGEDMVAFAYSDSGQLTADETPSFLINYIATGLKNSLEGEKVVLSVYMPNGEVLDTYQYIFNAKVGEAIE